MSSLTVIPITANYTLALSDVNSVVLADASSGSVTITLPDVSAPTDGINFMIKRVDTTLLVSVTIVGHNGSQTIDGSASVTTAKGSPHQIVSSAGKWYVLSN